MNPLKAGDGRPVAWVTGAGGLIGSHVGRLAAECAPGWDVRLLTREHLELADPDAVAQAFAEERPGLVIHCAALSRGPACQADPVLARRLNVGVTAHLATLAHAIPLVFLSTDLVFDGRKGNYVETDAVNPLFVYAETKVEAELLVLQHPRHLVVRTSLNHGVSPTGDRGFNEEMVRAWHRGDALRLFTDEFRCPIPALATARAIWELVGQEAVGVFHVAGAERLSRWELGQLVAARHPELRPRLEAASLRNFAGPPRPPDVTLVCGKAQARLGFPLPRFSEWLRHHEPVP